MARMLGEAFFTVYPDTTGFRSLLDVQIRKSIAGLNPNVRVGADTSGATASILGLQARMKALSSSLATLRLNADDKAAEATIAKLQARLLGLSKQMSSLVMKADTSQLDAQIAKEEARLATLQHQMSNLVADADTAKAAAKIAQLDKQVAGLYASLDNMDADVDITAALTKIYALEAELRVLKSDSLAVKLAADSAGLDAQIAASETKIATLKAEAADVQIGGNVDVGKLAAAEAALLGLESATERVTKATGDADEAFSLFTRGARNFAGVYGLLTGNIRLFGGALDGILPKALSEVGALHVLADAAVEITAVWVPAAIALAAFGIAAAGTATQIAQRFEAIQVVTAATGKTIPPLTNAFEQLQDSVKPQVFQLFGEGLVEMEHNTGAFQLVAKETGTAVDQLGARFVYATTQGKGISDFAKGLAPDFAKLGDSIGNFFGILGNLFKAVPGYAQILLSVGDGMLHIIEVFTAAAVPVLKWGLILHGAILYSGLAVSAFVGLAGGIASLGKAFVTFGVSSLAGVADRLSAFGTKIVDVGLAVGGWVQEIGAAEGVAGKFGAALAPLAANPMLWVTAAAIALGALVFAIIRSTDAAQQFNNTMQQTIQNAQLSSVVAVIQNAQIATAAKLAATTQQLNEAIKTNTTVNAGRAGALNSNGAAISNLATATDQYHGALTQLDQQQQLVSTRFTALSKQYGSNAAALGVLNQAGITSAQITDTNAQHWAEALIQINATTQAYKLMGVQAGQLGNDLDVLGRTETEQYTATQKLNQGWQQFITDVTGTQSAFDTVDEGFNTLSSTGAKFTDSLGRLKVSGLDYVKSGIDSLTPSGIALNQAFTQQIGNVNTLYASWRTAGLANNLFTQGVKDSIAPLVKYAAGSQEATAQLIALAQQAGYQGPISLQALTKWLGNTHDATQNLKNITDQATTQEALLTGAMQNQGAYIANQLIGDINQAILKYNGVEAAAKAYGNAVAKSGQQSDAAHAARQTLINDIIKSGQASKDSTGQIAAMITKVLGIPAQKAIQIVMKGTGSYSLSEINAATGKQQQAATGGYVNLAGRLMRAAGGYIQMGSGPTADDVPIMASRGEFVVKASSVARYGKSMMDQINAGHYAAGGLVNTGNTSVLSGQYAVTISDSFQKSFTNSFTAAMQKSLKSAETAALSAFQSANVPNSGAGVQRWLGTVLQALALNGLPSSLANQVLYQIGTESGGNPNAINLTDCLYIDCMILTQRGWLKHDEVEVGDLTIGYNKTSGRSEWTEITRVVHYDDAPLIRIGNKRWSVLATPNHRWLNEVPVSQDSGDPAECTEQGCAWPGDVRRRGVGTTGGYRIHMARKHGVKLPRRAGGTEVRFVETEQIKLSGHYRLRLAAPADTGEGLALTDQEAELLGWILGDGHVRYAGKTTHRGRTLVTLTQAKPQFVPLCRSLVASVDEGYSEYQNTLPSGLASYTWALGKDYGLGLLERSGYASPQQMVLGMSASQRAAFLRGVMGAEGSAQGGHARIPQVYGDKADAIVLAIFLNGYRPSVSDKAGADEPHGWSPSGSFGMCRPHITPLVKEDAGTGPVWCVTTGLGTWTARGDDGMPFLTGNSNAAAGDPSRGLLQTIGSTFDAYHVAGTSTNIYDPLANIAAAINYARHVYGPSLMRGGMGLGSGHGYALGGLINGYASGGIVEAMSASGGAMPATHMITPAGGYATGGQITLAKYLPQLKAAQASEAGDYGGLRKAYLADIKGARTGSWTSGHKAGITSELGTLASRQAAEVTAYNTIISHGTANANLSKFGTRVKDVLTVTKDQDLKHSHPGWTSGLQYWLGVLTHLSQSSVAPPYAGSQAKLQFGTWIAKAKTTQAHEAADYAGLQSAFKTGLSHARKGTWLYQNRTALGERLYAVAVKQNQEAAAWADLNKHATGSVSDLAGMAGRIAKLGSTANATTSSLQPALLGHLPGGHPGWLKALTAQLKALTSLAAVPPYNPPWAPGSLGPTTTVAGGVLGFDTGRNVLRPGLNLTWNGTGRDEALSRSGAGAASGPVTVVVQNNGVIGSEVELRNWMTRQLNNMARGGYLSQAVKTAMT